MINITENNINNFDHLGLRSLFTEGNNKRLYAIEGSKVMIMEFTHANAEARNSCSANLFSYISSLGIKTHFNKKLTHIEQSIQKAQLIPIHIYIHNLVNNNMAHMLGMHPLTALSCPLIEYRLASKALKYPLITEQHIQVFDLADRDAVSVCCSTALRVNDIASTIFRCMQLTLVSMRLTFGYIDDQICLIDELSPDTFTCFKSDVMITPDMFYLQHMDQLQKLLSY